MNISEIFIRRPVATILIMLTILFFGVMSYKYLPVSDLPNVDYPTIQVSVSYPGAQPELIANSVATPLEKQFSTMTSIQTITSSNVTGSSSIFLQFDLDRNIDLAAIDVQEAINAASAQLPQDLPYAPTYQKVNPAATPILYLAISSATMSLGDLYDYGQNILGQQLNMVEGVAQVQVFGSPFAVRVRVDPQKMAARGIGINDVAASIKNQNTFIPVGTLYGKKTEFIIDVNGQIAHAAGYDPLIIKNDNGAITRLQDIGYALDSVSYDKYYLQYQTKDIDQPTVILAIQKQTGSNALKVIDGVNKMLPRLEKELPGSVHLHRIFDKSLFIKESVSDVQITVFVAFILVVLIIYIYLGRMMNTLIPTLALPMSIVGTFIVMLFCGFSIDILSLLAISLSIGFLVDDAVVVLENIVRHVEAGEKPFKAALDGSKEICFTIISMTLCLCSVFIPMLFMGGVVGRIFNEFAVVIVTAVLLSGFISLSLTAMLCSRLVPERQKIEKRTRMEKISEKINTFLLRNYEKSLRRVMKHRVIVLIAGAACLVGSVVLFQRLPKDFFPPDDLGFIQGMTQSVNGTSAFEMQNYQEELSDILRKNSNLTSIVSIGANPIDSQGALFLQLKPFGERPPIDQVLKQVYKDLYMVPGVKVFLKQPPLIDLQVGTSSTTGDYQYTMQGVQTVDLYDAANKMFMKLRSTKGFSQVFTDLQMTQPMLKIDVLRDRASLLNITAGDIENAFNLAYAGSNLSPIKEPNNLYYVIMETIPKYYRDPSALSQFYLRSPSNDMIPLTEVIEMRESLGPQAVNHINTLPSVTISFNLVDIPLSTGITEIEKLAKDTLPPSVTGSLQGTASVFKTSFANLTVLLLISVFVIYVILGILYENLYHPLTVMTTLPPAAVGGLLVLLIFNLTFTIYAFVGIILLLGIVLKNGIILIDFANDAIVKDKMVPEDAIFHAALTRFRPILMTTISALMGAVPIALGVGGQTAQSRRALGLVIVGGLIFSQILTLYLTPITYLYIEKLREKIEKRFFKGEDETPQTPPINDAG